MRVALILLVCATLTACSEGISRSVLASVLVTNGEVEIDTQSNSAAARAGATLSPGATVRTGVASNAALELIPGARAQLAADSEFRIDELTLTKDGNETQGGMVGRTVRATLRRGKLVGIFEESDDAQAKFAVQTPHATVQITRGSTFAIDTKENATLVVCVRGNISAIPAGAAAETISAGYFCELSNAGLRKGPAAENSATQTALTEALATAAPLADLARPALLPSR